MAYSSPVSTQAVLVADNGVFPNSRLPAIVYRQALPGGAHDAASFEALFAANGWPPAWRDGIYDYHHYHSTAHECLGISRGQVRVLLGGADGEAINLAAGDVVVIPAGVAHQRLRSSADLEVVGAYPPGQSPDLLRGAPGERPRADQRIAQVPVPDSDPVQGPQGALTEAWQATTPASH